MGSTTKTKTPRKKPIGLRFVHETQKTSISMIIGFAFCQLWLSLCFFAPQLFPDNASVSVYEMSLVVCVLVLIPCLVSPVKVAAFLSKKITGYILAAAASIGTFLIPFSAGEDTFAFVLQIFAALLTGLASGYFFIVWYQAFCKADDLAGFVLSVVTSSVFMYALTAVAYLPQPNPWVMVLIACVLPFVSAFFLNKAPQKANYTTEPHFPPKHSPQRKTIFLLCLGLFVVSFTDEFMRNYYLEGTDLVFYSGGLNFVLILIKVAASVLLVAILAEYSHHMPAIYRASFLLAMIAVLFMPYVKHNPNFLYGITNFGAFLFKIMVMVIAFNYCQRFRTAPILVFALTRMTFSLDLLLGFALFHLYKILSPFIPDLLGILSVILGVLVIATYLFVFNEKRAAPVFVKVEAEDEKKGTLSDRCDFLANVGKLSKRESEVLRLIAKGRSTPRIQKELHLSVNTVNTHISHIYQKLNVHSRQELLDLIEM